MADGHTDTETYDNAHILDMAVPIGSGYSLAEFRLPKGQTAWNPRSTKAEKALRGPIVLRYLIHASGVDATEFGDDGQCIATPSGNRCTNRAEAGRLRCYEHPLIPA